MFVYYLLLILAALIFASQFLVTKQYQRYKGTGFYSTLKLSFFAYLTIALFFFIKGCIAKGSFSFGFSWFTFGMTLGIAVVSLACVVMGIKVLSVGDMGIYSVFMMLGSMVMPTLVGLIFYEESFTALKGIALALMAVAIVLSLKGVNKTRIGLKALLFYFGIFAMNGMIGVLFTVHQNHAALTADAVLTDGAYTVDNDIFMSWYGLSTVLLSGVVWACIAIARRANRRPAPAAEWGVPYAEGAERAAVTAKARILVAVLPVLYGTCNGLGDYFIALGTQPGALGSSVTFPIVNGGTILFSTLIGCIFFREKFTVRTALSLVIVVAATVIFMFA